MRKFLLLAAIAGILLYVYRETAALPAPYDRAALQAARRAKNQAFRQSAASPLPPDQQAHFDSLKYYPAAPAWNVVAQLHRNPVPDTIGLTLSDNCREIYRRWGRADFAAPGGPAQHLTLFQRTNGADSTLFVPFTDPGNGHNTYGGGRYLDVPQPAPAAAEITLDFNRAYNPYCAYNNGYSCPVPPAENRLTVAVPAGEKAWHE